MALGNLASIWALQQAAQDLKNFSYFYLKTRNDLKDHLTSEETFSALSDNDEVLK